MTITDDTAFDLFMEAALDADDRGYPETALFVSEDLPNADDIIGENVHSGRPTVVITGDGIELLLMPCRRIAPLRWLDNLRGRTTIMVGWRHHNLASPYTVKTTVGHRPLSDMRRRVICA